VGGRDRAGDEPSRDQGKPPHWLVERCHLPDDPQHRGAIMGDNPKTSVVNKYLQAWDVHNVFSMGAGAFPQNAGYNPTATVAALTYHAAQEIIGQYLQTPGPLVRG